MPYFRNLDEPNITGVHSGTSTDVAEDLKTHDNGQHDTADAGSSTKNNTGDSSSNDHSSNDYSHYETDSFERATINHIGSALNVNTGANYGTINQQDFGSGQYNDYHDDDNEQRERWSGPRQAPWGYYQGPYHNFSHSTATVNPTSPYRGFYYSQYGPRGYQPPAAYHPGFWQARPATYGTPHGGHSQPAPRQWYHAQNNGVHNNDREAPEGSIIDSDEEE